MSMRLYQTDRSILNDTYYDYLGRKVYKVHTPSHFPSRTTMITKFLSPDINNESPTIHGSSTRNVDEGTDNKPRDGLTVTPDPFVYLAQIIWRVRRCNAF
ncbi:hypothetical protein K435DRAFT_879512 [Dendrothele bispora CBS 962.96]|uniref:Uncharacterized protein n=1 Tax=Dendrothele bispora (strain CBS 962.96) TaxID=1314807 RepID=A0A4S8KLB8_DENBC|nr:hypothetical protein K435DRAFT_879512 [Dendrothele bispora CBS 962.96]